MKLSNSVTLFLALCALGPAHVAQAQDAAAPPPTAGTATTPALPPAPPAPPARPAPLPEPRSSTTPDNTRYLNRPSLLRGCTAQVASFKDKPCDIIFIGDSITEGWLGRGHDVWQKSYGSRKALDFGIGGDKTQNVLWRFDNMDVKALRPKVAVVLIGTNNTQNTPYEIADGVKAVLTKTQQTFPGVKTILVSIMPNSRANQKMMDTDALIKNYADDKSVFYLDLVPLMPPVGDNWKGLSSDHLHPDASGYQIWADAMEPLLTRLLGSG